MSRSMRTASGVEKLNTGSHGILINDEAANLITFDEEQMPVRRVCNQRRAASIQTVNSLLEVARGIINRGGHGNMKEVTER